MITAITFNFQINKKFLNKDTVTNKVLGDRFTTDLEELLRTDIQFMQKIYALITDLNKDLLTCQIAEKVEEHTGYKPAVTETSKHKRHYFFGGLYIYEEDQIMK